MAIIQCPRGHFYNNKKNMQCPYCGQNEEETMTVRLDPASSIQRDVLNLMVDKKERYVEEFDDQKTISIFSKNKGNDFVTGWIVCVDGPEKGRAYELHYGFNRIGRNPQADIFLEEDRQITRGIHCSVVYEYNKNEFFLVPEEGNLVYMQDDFIPRSVKLKTGDVFKIGGSEFEFIAFCRGERKWEKTQ